MYMWNVIVNRFHSLCEQGSSVYSVFPPIVLNNINWVAHVKEMHD